MGDGDILPGGVVEGLRVGALIVDGVGLGEVVEVLRACPPVFSGICGIAEGELPAVFKPGYGLCS